MADDRQAKAERIHTWEERAAIIEHVGRFVREDAEDMATRELGYRPEWRGSIVKLIEAGEGPRT